MCWAQRFCCLGAVALRGTQNPKKGFFTAMKFSPVFINRGMEEQERHVRMRTSASFPVLYRIPE